MRTTARRPGFTLVELLIVMGIIVLAAAILVPVTLSLTERNQVPKAASMIENALQVAKSRAVALRRPAGIRLMAAQLTQRATVSGPAFAWYNQIQYVEDLGDYVEGWVWGLADVPPARRLTVQPFWTTATPYPGQVPAGFAQVDIAAGNIPPASPTQFQFAAIIDPNGTVNPTFTAARNTLLFAPISTNSNQSNLWTDNAGVQHLSQKFRYNFHLSTPSSILPGDKIELMEGGEIFTVLAVSTSATGNTVSNVNVGFNTANQIMCPIIAVDRALPRDVPPPLNGRPNYRVIRQPRIAPGMQPIMLPQEVVIDLTPSRGGNPPGQPAAQDYDTANNIYMSNISYGITVSGIGGLTTPVTNPNPVAPVYVDILFSPSGEVLMTSQNFRNPAGTEVSGFIVGSSDIIALWVHTYGNPDMWAARQATAGQGHADNQALVAVHARTGAIGSYPVSRPTATSVDPLRDVRLAKGRTSADTGP